MKKLFFTGLIIFLLCSTVFAGSLGKFSSAAKGSSGGTSGSGFLESFLDSCCSEAAIAGFRAVFYAAAWHPWYFCSPWNYGQTGSMTVAADKSDSRRIFTMHTDFEWRYMPGTETENDIMGYRVQTKLYSVMLFNFGVYFQNLWQDTGLGFQDDQRLGGVYFTFGGWVTKNFNIDFGTTTKV